VIKTGRKILGATNPNAADPGKEVVIRIMYRRSMSGAFYCYGNGCSF